MGNVKSSGQLFDANLVVETGITITAGSLIFADISGTNTVHRIRSYSATTVESAALPTGRGLASLDVQPAVGMFLGVMANTQTGVNGSQTGVTWYTQGVFEFNSTPTSSAAMRVGQPVFAIDHETVRCGWTGVDVGLAAMNLTGTTPIGVVSYLNLPINTNTAARRVRVKIFPHRTLQSFV